MALHSIGQVLDQRAEDLHNVAPAEVVSFEFSEGAPDSTRATLEIVSENIRMRFCLTGEQLELLALKANKTAALLERPA